MPIQVISQSADDTQRLGEQIGHLLSAGDVVCLYGELGTGKTVLSKGLAKGLGVADQDAVRSPSFVLIHRYQGDVPVYHADLYRLNGPTDIVEIGLRELLAGDGVVVIEWADKLDAALPLERLDIILEYEAEARRLITVHPQGDRYCDLVEQWQDQWGADTEASAPSDDGGGLTPT